MCVRTSARGMSASRRARPTRRSHRAPTCGHPTCAPCSKWTRTRSRAAMATRRSRVPDSRGCAATRRRCSVREAINELQRRLADGLAKIDPHHRLFGRPVSYRVIDGQALEVTYRDVAGIADAELQGVKRLIGRDCSCTVSPQTAESVTVRFVVPLK